MATVNTLGADVLSLRGADEEYHRISRFFRTRVEAQAALASSDWVPTAGVVNVCVTGDEGILLYDANDTVNGMLSNLDGPARTYIDSQISTLVGDSPDLLNTLSEIADALGDDPAFITTITDRLDDIEDGFDFTGAISAPVAGNVIPFYFANQASFPDATTSHGAIAHSHADGAMYFAHGGAWVPLALSVDLSTAQVQLDAVQSALGVTSGTDHLGSFTGTLIDDNSSVKEALQVLETTLEAVDIDTDDMSTLVGLAENVSDLGTFTGSTITDNGTVKEALQELETAVESEALTSRNAEAAIEDNVSDINAALGLNVGDQTFTFTEDLIVVELAPARATDHAGIYSDITTAGPDSATQLDIKTAVERFAANSRIVLAAEKHRLDAEDARMDGLVGVVGNNLGTFSGSTIADDTDVKTALQSLETASETETSERTAAIADILDGTTFTGSLVINRDFPDLELKSNGEKRLLFTDAGGGATAAIKHVSGSLDFYAGGIASSNKEMVIAADGVDVTALKLGGTPVSATAAELNYTGDLGTFTKDIISDNSDVKAALQELETSVASIQGAAKVHNYKWSNNNDATITAQHITTDAANWADATKVYIHRQARHSVDMQNAFNNMLLVGAKLYIQRTDVGDKFFTAIINSAATVTGTGTDQVFAYDVTDVSTIGQVFNENMRVNVGVFSNVNAKMVADVQADVDANEAASDAAEAALSARLDTLEADPTTATAVAAVQADVDQNESDADAAIAVERGRIDAILAGADADKDTFAEIVTLINSVDTTNDNAFAGYVASNDAAVAAVQADVDQNEADADAAIAGILDGATFTGDIILKKPDGSDVALVLSRTDHADMNTEWHIQPSYVSINKECLNILAGSTPVIAFDERARVAINTVDPDYTLDVGGDGKFSTNLIVGGTLTLGSTAITATAAELNYVDGVTSNIQTQLNAIQADVDQNESDADAAVAANEVHIDNMVGLTGRNKDETHLGTFSGTTISSNTSIRAALQELETAVEATPASSTASDTTKTQVATNSADYFLTFVDSNNTNATAEAVRTGTHLKFNPSTKVLDISTGTVHAQYLTLANVNVNSTAAELNILDGCTATAAELNILDGVTATTAELNYVDGVTSNIQTQLDAKLAAETITLTAFKAVVAASSDFGDFQTRVAAL